MDECKNNLPHFGHVPHVGLHGYKMNNINDLQNVFISTLPYVWPSYISHKKVIRKEKLNGCKNPNVHVPLGQYLAHSQ